MKQEIQEALDKLGIEYSNRWGEKRLQELLDVHTAPESAIMNTDNIESEILGLEKPTVDEILEKSVQTPDGRKLDSGIIIPVSVLRELNRTKYFYHVVKSSDRAVVYKVDPKNKESEVRAYEPGLHGDNFAELAQQFVDKNNK